MPFPYSYNHKVEISSESFSPENYSNEEITNFLLKEISKHNILNLKSDKKRISFSSKNSLFRFEYKIIISVEQLRDKTFINYKIELEKLIMITLFGVICLAFFSFISVRKFLIIAGIFAIVFYSVNLFFINIQVSKIINTAIGKNEFDFGGSESFSNEQKEWMNNPDKCPACGCYVGRYDINCPDCGLKVKKKNYKIPLDTTKYKDKTIKYHFKEKKK